jgi:hypothetical protein
MNSAKHSPEEPWYAPPKKQERPSSGTKGGSLGSSSRIDGPSSTLDIIKTIASSAITLFFAIASGILIGWQSTQSDTGSLGWFLTALAILGIFFSFLFLLRQMGSVVARLLPSEETDSPMQLAFRLARGEIRAQESRKGSPAPELALYQFVQQVRAYATEKSYQKNRPTEKLDANLLRAEPADLLKRRWHDVMDSLAEFEIYLANDPQGMIQKLISKYPTQVMDVSQIFREVAENFDTTWRRKGINIECAIVTPLKATTNEALLRRLLVGPWRSSAYFARRGNSVFFSAKSIEGKVVARWETEGLVIKDEYLKIALDNTLPVNERIERGMASIATDPNSPNTLHALISFITWIDLAKATSADFAFKHANDGFVIELNFK